MAVTEYFTGQGNTCARGYEAEKQETLTAIMEKQFAQIMEAQAMAEMSIALAYRIRGVPPMVPNEKPSNQPCEPISNDLFTAGYRNREATMRLLQILSDLKQLLVVL